MNDCQIIIKFLIIFSLNLKYILIKSDCGLPAIPDSTKLNIFKSRYGEEIQIEYECEPKNGELIEGKYRQCINHRWNGSIPRCAIEMNKIILRTINIEESGNHRPVYKEFVTRQANRRAQFKAIKPRKQMQCFTQKYLWNIVGNQNWVFQLTRGLSFNYFILYMKGGFLLENKNNNNLTFSARIEDIVSSKVCQLEQLSLVDNFYTYKIGFICNTSQPSIAMHEGVDESIQDLIINVRAKNRLNVTTIFCALKLYKISDSCGSPEIPLNSHVLARERTYSVYSCKEGYYIEGIQKVKCDSNGKWINEFPICKPNNTCRIPPDVGMDLNLNVEYKNVVKINGTLFVEPEGLALYSCYDSTNESIMQFEGETSRICKDGKWSGTQPNCYHTNNAIEMAFDYKPTVKGHIMRQSISKTLIVVMAMLGSFTVGAISVGFVIYLTIKKKSNFHRRPNVSIIIDEVEDYDKSEDYSSVRVSQSSNFSNEVINPLYEDSNKCNSTLSIPNETNNHILNSNSYL